eukprot:CAMPEP_0174279444 /NCGR_PEP_ID=MMETSP0439-20130205/62038_1 /TAXON_ID=0 /ORGANISM="Stereomyxa ramosa, Strain Chinc5" /LENGTH=267 /DNA_ID=CAMNT_0015371969 /DNA_START=1211 /DNA_END=2011 /DNA_ORIENTATION=+
MRSIGLSKLLHYVPNGKSDDNTLTDTVVALWNIVLFLLEDDDIGIRELGAGYVSETMAHIKQQTTDSQMQEQNSQLEGVKMSASAGLTAVFSHLGRHFGNSSAYRQLIECFVGCNNTEFLNADIHSSFHFLSVSWGDFGGRLFEQEGDNLYIENLLYTQNASFQLKKLLTHNRVCEKDVEKWTNNFLTSLIETLKWLISVMDEYPGWIKWATYEKEVFERFTKIITPLVVLLSHSPDQSLFKNELETVFESIGSLPAENMNPMITHQ